MKEHASIFNDVLGPVMIGPSSSHTAASVRIGRRWSLEKSSIFRQILIQRVR